MKILVIRRDNIGDLICTTPLIRSLRITYPDARIDALVNSYNKPVLDANPDLNHVYAYTKVKHRENDESVFGVYWRRLKMMFELRKVNYDWVVVGNTGMAERAVRLSKQVNGKKTIGFVRDRENCRNIDVPVLDCGGKGLHLVEEMNVLAKHLGATCEIPSLVLLPVKSQQEFASEKICGFFSNRKMLIAIHISSRKPPQRWPANHFIALMRDLHAKYGAQFLLFWSPGDEHNPHHPGDDHKAAEIMEAVKDLPVLAYPTEKLEELIGAISVCDAMICSDGGAMHVGAGLGKPIVCFFGNSDAAVWHPWGVPYELLQKESRNVADISAEEALQAFERLLPFIKMERPSIENMN